jgi:hypothetical protein
MKRQLLRFARLPFAIAVGLALVFGAREARAGSRSCDHCVDTPECNQCCFDAGFEYGVCLHPGAVCLCG